MHLHYVSEKILIHEKYPKTAVLTLSPETYEGHVFMIANKPRNPYFSTCNFFYQLGRGCIAWFKVGLQVYLNSYQLKQKKIS